MKTWKSLLLCGAAALALTQLPAQATSTKAPLVEAAAAGNLAEVKALLESDRRTNYRQNYDIDSRDWWGETALHAACKNGQVEVVRYLISKGADLNAPDFRRIGYEGAEICATDWCSNETPLHEACKNGNLEIVKMLVDAGAQLDPVDCGGNTPLTNAAAKGHLEAVKYLVWKTARLDMENSAGHTPLWAAVANGHVPVVEFLLFSGAPVGTYDYDRLMMGQVSKNDQILQLLKKRGLH